MWNRLDVFHMEGVASAVAIVSWRVGVLLGLYSIRTHLVTDLTKQMMYSSLFFDNYKLFAKI